MNAIAYRKMSTFRALVAKTKKSPAVIEVLTRDFLPESSTVKNSPGKCDTLVKVQYSNLNYKDALVVGGKFPGLKVPVISGIDLVGTVEETTSTEFKAGDAVLINGFGIGTDHHGGFSELASVRHEWLLRLPENLSPLDAARIGTAGYTAMLCVDAITSCLKPTKGEILVTGATGGVGSISVALLAGLGYKVAAMTGKTDEAAKTFLTKLGASSIVARSEFEGEPVPLAKEKFAGCIDSTGGVILSNALSQIKYGGLVAACGLACGMDLKTTVAPFILRGVTLRGIDSVYMDLETRKRVYEAYVPLLLKNGSLDLVTGSLEQVIALDKVLEVSQKMLAGQTKGRYVVKLGD